MKADKEVLGVVLVFALAALCALPYDRVFGLDHADHVRANVPSAIHRTAGFAFQK